MNQGNSSNARETEFGALPADADIDALVAQLHAAFNIANSLGAWLGGIAIAAGWGHGSPNLVAAGLAAVGLVVAFASGRLEPARRRRDRVAA